MNMFGTRRDREPLNLPRRLSTTHARYFNMNWDGPATTRNQSLSNSVSPRKPATIHSDLESTELPVLPTRRATFAPIADAYPFSLLDRSPIESDFECSSWAPAIASSTRSWLGSKVERKIRNPTACDSIGYEIRGLKSLRTFLVCVPLMIIWCFLLMVICNLRPGNSPSSVFNASFGPGFWGFLYHAEALVCLGGGLLYSQGYHNLRSARDSMASLQHSSITTAYSFLKTLRDNRKSVSELQPLIYECLALLTAYPVALTQKFKGNTCEPDITRYCQDTAIALYHMRDRDGMNQTGQRPKDNHCGVSDHSNHGEFAVVDCFFEVFSLHLELEYQRHQMRTRVPSQGAEHIIYNLRNHFENIVDWGNMHERRTPIVRENADLMSLSGRQAHTMAKVDAQPSALLWSVRIAAVLIALALPLQLGEMIQPQTTIGGDQPPIMGSASLFMSIIGFSIVGAAVLTLLEELGGMWDPYGRGLNTFAWTLGIAMEIDTMLNEFYESDDNVIVRKQSYFCPGEEHASPCSSWCHSSTSRRPVYSPSGKLSEETGDSEDRPQTV